MSQFARGAKIKPPKLSIEECWCALLITYDAAGMPSKEKFLMEALFAFDAWKRASQPSQTTGNENAD